MGMVKCKECGTEISSKAKACPQCGADPRSWWGRRNIVSKLVIGFWGFIFAMAIIGRMLGDGEVSETTTVPETTVAPETEAPQITPASTIIEVLSLSEPKQLFYDLVAEQDKCYEKFEITLDVADLPGSECDKEAYVTVAEKYDITPEEAEEISLRGIKEGWPMPSQITPAPPTTQPTVKGDDYYKTLIELTLQNGGIDVESIEIADGRSGGGVKSVIIAYTSYSSTEEGIAQEVGAVIGVFIGAKEEGMDIDEMAAVVGDAQGNAIGMYYCTKEWADSYIAGDMTMMEISLKVLGTLTAF